MTEFAVERRPAANSQPVFADDDDTTPDPTPGTSDQSRMVKETAKHGSSVGNAVVATDADNDPLLYTLAGEAPAAFTAAPADATPPNSADLFAVDKRTGQISVKSGANLAFLDRETYATTGTTAGGRRQ